MVDCVSYPEMTLCVSICIYESRALGSFDQRSSISQGGNRIVDPLNTRIESGIAILFRID